MAVFKTFIFAISAFLALLGGYSHVAGIEFNEVPKMTRTFDVAPRLLASFVVGDGGKEHPIRVDCKATSSDPANRICVLTPADAMQFQDSIVHPPSECAIGAAQAKQSKPMVTAKHLLMTSLQKHNSDMARYAWARSKTQGSLLIPVRIPRMITPAVCAAVPAPISHSLMVFNPHLSAVNVSLSLGPYSTVCSTPRLELQECGFPFPLPSNSTIELRLKHSPNYSLPIEEIDIYIVDAAGVRAAYKVSAVLPYEVTNTCQSFQTDLEKEAQPAVHWSVYIPGILMTTVLALCAWKSGPVRFCVAFLSKRVARSPKKKPRYKLPKVSLSVRPKEAAASNKPTCADPDPVAAPVKEMEGLKRSNVAKVSPRVVQRRSSRPSVPVKSSVHSSGLSSGKKNLVGKSSGVPHATKAKAHAVEAVDTGDATVNSSKTSTKVSKTVPPKPVVDDSRVEQRKKSGRGNRVQTAVVAPVCVQNRFPRPAKEVPKAREEPDAVLSFNSSPTPHSAHQLEPKPSGASKSKPDKLIVSAPSCVQKIEVKTHESTVYLQTNALPGLPLCEEENSLAYSFETVLSRATSPRLLSAERDSTDSGYGGVGSTASASSPCDPWKLLVEEGSLTAADDSACFGTFDMDECQHEVPVEPLPVLAVSLSPSLLSSCAADLEANVPTVNVLDAVDVLYAAGSAEDEEVQSIISGDSPVSVNRSPIRPLSAVSPMIEAHHSDREVLQDVPGHGHDNLDDVPSAEVPLRQLRSPIYATMFKGQQNEHQASAPSMQSARASSQQKGSQQRSPWTEDLSPPSCAQRLVMRLSPVLVPKSTGLTGLNEDPFSDVQDVLMPSSSRKTRSPFPPTGWQASQANYDTSSGLGRSQPATLNMQYVPVPCSVPRSAQAVVPGPSSMPWMAAPHAFQPYPAVAILPDVNNRMFSLPGNGVYPRGIVHPVAAVPVTSCVRMPPGGMPPPGIAPVGMPPSSMMPAGRPIATPMLLSSRPQKPAEKMQSRLEKALQASMASSRPYPAGYHRQSSSGPIVLTSYPEWSTRDYGSSALKQSPPAGTSSVPLRRFSASVGSRNGQTDFLHRSVAASRNVDDGERDHAREEEEEDDGNDLLRMCFRTIE